MMTRRSFLKAGSLTACALPGLAYGLDNTDPREAVADVLTQATTTGQVSAASLCIRQGNDEYVRHFGAARSINDLFLLGSISKPMSVAAVMTLFDQDAFALDDPAHRFLPEFLGEDRKKITIRHLMTHVSGLPDQLPENDLLRARHAPLSEFVDHALRTPLVFEPGTRYGYSSMAILLASEIARRISGIEIPEFVDQTIFRPLGMEHSALGLGRFPMEAVTPCQTERAAPESGAGDPDARSWDWNSPYWRGLGAPWGGAHASAPDVARFLAEFLHQEGKVVRPETARAMIRNQRSDANPPRGLGFALGASLGGPGCSDQTFGHTGSTGTLAWADPRSKTICVILTTLPGRAVEPHPRAIASERLAGSLR
ncbi:serine hydrolase domain-containing protein [Tautonia marina]|uniref:serine hydrolase domain-containing protein n=1 Tax=Tautonia marina TaxID=2653855 RepID=UPI00191C5A9C|nr:serine hydrolase domain-containing protein [Tautonia marina]